jgi:acetyl-CoA carboxylase, biotin carboxylase subunit
LSRVDANVTIRRLLIANRGEIAARIIRTCQHLGIEAVLGASDVDLAGAPARLADQVVRLGPPPAAASYLNVAAVVAAARAVGADAVHPGYGFLAESARLAQACERAGIVFIGPTAEQLAVLGDKLAARRHAQDAGLPVAPGAEVVGAGRHVEVPVLADGAEVVHLGDRDGSIQRRRQKLVVQAPAPGLDEELRSRLHQAAVALARRLGYRGVGTVEFLVDPERGSYSFLEMNASVQVQHPVTEAITGLDLVAEQIAVAEGLPLRITQDAVAVRGHAIGCRINCEDWRHDMWPTPGSVTRIAIPIGPGLRVDTHLQAGDEIPPHYDFLVAKLIASGGDRAEALERLRSALRRFTVDGIVTTIPMHLALTQEPEFVAGGVDTTWFDRFLRRQGRTAAAVAGP